MRSIIRYFPLFIVNLLVFAQVSVSNYVLTFKKLVIANFLKVVIAKFLAYFDFGFGGFKEFSTIFHVSGLTWSRSDILKLLSAIFG